jgi:phospholipase D1/2
MSTVFLKFIPFFSMVMHWQYMSICRGGKGILEKLSEVGINPEKYITFYSLRGYDKVHHVNNNKHENKSVKSKRSLLSIISKKEKQNQERLSEDNSMQSNSSNLSLEKSQSLTESKQSEVSVDNESKSGKNKETQRFSKISFSDEKVGELIVPKHFTEEIYIHSKLMIVDDRYVIIGSGKEKFENIYQRFFLEKNIGKF